MPDSQTSTVPVPDPNPNPGIRAIRYFNQKVNQAHDVLTKATAAPTAPRTKVDLGSKVKSVLNNFVSTTKSTDWLGGTDAAKSKATDQANKTRVAAEQKNPYATYKSLANTQATGFQHDKVIADATAARQIKNPLEAPTPQLQMVALSGKMQRVVSAPEWQTLPPQYKLRALSEIYDRFVDPVFKNNGISPLSKDSWMARYAEHILSPEQYQQYSKDYAAKSAKAEQDLVADIQAHPEKYPDPRPKMGVGSVFTEGVSEEIGKTAKLASNLLNLSAKAFVPNSVKNDPLRKSADAFAAFAEEARSVNTSALAAFAPQQGLADWLANTAGHMIGAAPAFTMVAGAGTALGIPEAGEAVIPSLAERGAVSKGTEIGLAALRNAGEVFTLEKGEGETWKDSTRDAAYALAFSGALHGAILKFKGAKLAVGGEPFANDIDDRANSPDGAKGESTPGRLVSSVAQDDQTAMSAAEHQVMLRHQVAAQFYPDKAAKFTDVKGKNSLFYNLSKAKRALVMAYIDGLSNEDAAKLMPITNPEVVQAANRQAREEWYKQSPEDKKIDDDIEKRFGVNLDQVVQETLADKVGHETGLTGPAAEIKDSLKSDEYEPPEGAYATLSPDFKAYLRNSKDTPLQKLKSRFISAEDFINGTTKYLPDSEYRTKGKFEFEDPEHHLLWIATQADLKGLSNVDKIQLRNKAFKFLRDEMGDTHAQALERGGWLREHYEEIKKSEPRLKQKGVAFGSTKLGPRRYATQAARVLYNEDAEASAKAWLRSNFKKNPKLRAVFEPLFNDLQKLKNKQTTFQAVRKYRILAEKVEEAMLETN